VRLGGQVCLAAVAALLLDGCLATSSPDVIDESRASSPQAVVSLERKPWGFLPVVPSLTGSRIRILP